MLLYQAARQVELHTGSTPAPLAEMRDAAQRAALRRGRRRRGARGRGRCGDARVGCGACLGGGDQDLAAASAAGRPLPATTAHARLGAGGRRRGRVPGLPLRPGPGEATPPGPE
ncbi:hypothetical protein [Streptoalloteichus tenebrarius]|uniref:hypothetical protein n=1 Tax=Streptoalloteichus tenebrarius (strain ATCC 17920 / DSM 40477 / JCM 4838 / CBS 697.72 / NBRC 16177 / NCIMB 11028 / NRRL B-12390 / A12253. 1 / ISP 5477) TaxID=1933 RepID=UPI003555E09F